MHTRVRYAVLWNKQREEATGECEARRQTHKAKMDDVCGVCEPHAFIKRYTGRHINNVVISSLRLEHLYLTEFILSHK